MNTRSFLRFMFLGTLAVLLPIQASAQPTAPTITTQPSALTVAAGGSATFNVVAAGSGTLTYGWFKEGRLVAFGGNAALTITAAAIADAGTYRVVVTGPGGSTVSNSVTLTVTGSAPPPTTPPSSTETPPAITTHPTSVIVTAGGRVDFTVTATGTATLRYRWLKNGRAIEDANAATFSIAAAKLEDAAIYTVVVSNAAGSVTSTPAALTVNATAGVIAVAPASQSVNAGVDAKLTVTTVGTGLAYQWKFAGRPLKGATNATLTLANAGTTVDGIYLVTVSNSTGPVAASAATLAIKTDARLVNIATRGHVGDDDEVLISGFVTRGTGSKKMLLRAVGPTLGTAFNVSGALAAPRLTLYSAARGNVVIDANGGWGGSTALSAAFAQVGAFPLPATSADAALLVSLAAGGYSASVSAPRGTGGVALLEVYDADTGTPTAEVVNISTRALVGAEAANTLIAGFAITGTTSNTVLVRGVGPSLGTLFGMRRALGASHIAVYDSRGNQVAENTIWGKAGRGEDDDDDDDDKKSDIDDASDRAGAWRLPRGSHDSALLLTLAPGVYTAHVTGVRASGIGLVEIFEVR